MSLPKQILLCYFEKIGKYFKKSLANKTNLAMCRRIGTLAIGITEIQIGITVCKTRILQT